MAFSGQARYVSGSPTMVPHTPVGAVAAGEVVVTADTPRVAHLDIAANTLGALAAVGGVYEVAGNAAIAADKAVYWDNAANQVTESAAAGVNKPFGVTVTACTGAAAKCLVRHDPAIAIA